MAGNKPRKHHWVPISYLRYFRDPATAAEDPKVWVFDRGVWSKRTKPRYSRAAGIFHERDLYALEGPSGERDYTIEKLLGDLIDSRYPPIVAKIEKRQPLNEGEHLDLCIFTAAQLMRTPGALRMFENLEEQLERMHQEVAGAERDEAAEKERRRKSANSNKRVFVKMIPQIAEMLLDMNLGFGLAPTIGPRFITSDRPCFMRNSRPPGHPFSNPGLGQPDIEVYLPISPLVVATFSRSNWRGYIQFNKQEVEESNRMIQGHADRWFISSAPRANLYWFSRYPLDLWFVVRILTGKVANWARLMFGRYVRRG